MSGSNDHPSDESLFANGDADATAQRHLDGCDACRTRARRLRAGASLIALAKTEAPSVEWRALDANILAAADSTAAAIRAGSLRAPRRIATTVYVGVALAAAAAGVFMLRMDHTPPGDAPRVAVASPNGVSPIAAPVHPTVAVLDPEAARQGDGVVLMLVSPVAYHHAGAAEATPLAGETRVHAGDRIGVGEHGGRALVALRTGYRLDARAGASVRVASLSRADTTVALEQGEARLDGPMPADGERVTMETGGWTLAAKGGAFVAKVEHDVVRLRVVAGKVDVSRAGGVVHEALAGEEVELSQGSNAIHVVSHDARDPSAIDAALFADAGQGFALARLGDHGAMTVAGHGSLPAGTEFVRVASRLDLEAGAPGGETWSLSIEPGHAAPNAWQRAPRIATASVHYGATAVASVPVIAPAVVAVPPVRPAPANLVGAARARWNVAESLRVAIADCGVAAGSHVLVAFDPNDDGSISGPRVSGVATDAGDCVAHHALSLRLPREAIPHPLQTVQFQLTTP